VGKELSTQNLDYITLCKQKSKNDVMYAAKPPSQNSTIIMIGSVKIGFQLITDRSVYF